MFLNIVLNVLVWIIKVQLYSFIFSIRTLSCPTHIENRSIAKTGKWCLKNNARIMNQTPETCAGGDSGAAAEADGVERPQSAPGSADPAGGAAGGG